MPKDQKKRAKRREWAPVPKKAAVTPEIETTAVAVVQNPYHDLTKVKDSATFQFFRETAWSIEPEEQRVDELQKRFKDSTWVYVCVTRISQAAAQVPPMIVRRDREGQANSIVRNRDFGLLTLLEEPNPYQSWYDFVEEAFVSWLLTGNVFIEKVLPDDVASLRPTQLYVLNPARVSIIPGPKHVAGYVYEVNGKRLPFLPEEISHTKFPHPTNDWYGLSPLTAGRVAIESEKASTDWNRNFLMHGSWPVGAIEAPNDMGKEEVRRLRREIKATMQTGKKQAGRLMLLTGGLTFNKIGLTPKDADWLKGSDKSRNDILAIYGVPFAVAGLFSSEQTTARSAGVVQQVKNFYLFTIFPLLKKFYANLTRDLARHYHPEFKLSPDFRSVPALQEDVDQELVRAEAYATLVAGGWTPNAALTQLYPHVNPFAHGDVAWLNSAMVPISGPVNPAMQQQGADPAQAPPPEKVVPPWQQRAWSRIQQRRQDRLARQLPGAVE